MPEHEARVDTKSIIILFFLRKVTDNFTYELIIHEIKFIIIFINELLNGFKFARLIHEKLKYLNTVKFYMIRRSGENRRKVDDPNYKGLERRSGNDRRSGIDRRKSVS
jgi:hypothetical protein